MKIHNQESWLYLMRKVGGLNHSNNRIVQFHGLKNYQKSILDLLCTCIMYMYTCHASINTIEVPLSIVQKNWMTDLCVSADCVPQDEWVRVTWEWNCNRDSINWTDWDRSSSDRFRWQRTFYTDSSWVEALQAMSWLGQSFSDGGFPFFFVN